MWFCRRRLNVYRNTLMDAKWQQCAIIAFIWGELRKLSTWGWLFSQRALSSGETTSWGFTTWCSPHMKAITVLLYQNYSKMFKTSLVCFVVDNKIISSIENTITEPDWKKTPIFNTFPVVRGCRQPIVSLYIIDVCVVHGLSPLSATFLWKHPHWLITFI